MGIVWFSKEIAVWRLAPPLLVVKEKSTTPPLGLRIVSQAGELLVGANGPFKLRLSEGGNTTGSESLPAAGPSTRGVGSTNTRGSS